jgi:hypothetical protein
MIGVVVWSSAPREKAIIWCEDQAMLAYLQGVENLVDPRQWPQPGDLVELDTRTVGSLRHALSVSMLSEQCCPDLPRILADAATEPRQPQLRLVSTQDLPLAGRAATAPSPASAAGYFEKSRSGVAS